VQFALYPLHFEFRARDSLYFPPGKAANILRGALGVIFRRIACVPQCRDSKTCDIRESCPYARTFEPSAPSSSPENRGPSGLADWPRPFVFRARHLDGHTIQPGGCFYFDLNVFSLDRDVLAYFILTFAALAREGLGPRRGKAELLRVSIPAQPTGNRNSHNEHDLPQTDTDPSPADADHSHTGTGHFLTGADHSLTEPDRKGGSSPQTIYDASTQTITTVIDPITLDLTPPATAPTRIRIDFLSPTELKHDHKIASRPEFPILFGRIRDRISTLSRLYGAGILDIDYQGTNDRASKVTMTSCRLRHDASERRSTRTGQSHPIGGFLGTAEYEGELAEFLPFLEAGRWTGVGRQSVWGKGQLDVKASDAS
jgi:hypothetical protein